MSSLKEEVSFIPFLMERSCLPPNTPMLPPFTFTLTYFLFLLSIYPHLMSVCVCVCDLYSFLSVFQRHGRMSAPACRVVTH